MVDDGREVLDGCGVGADWYSVPDEAVNVYGGVVSPAAADEDFVTDEATKVYCGVAGHASKDETEYSVPGENKQPLMYVGVGGGGDTQEIGGLQSGIHTENCDTGSMEVAWTGTGI